MEPASDQTTQTTPSTLYREAPHLQDRWEDQVALEQEMLATGRTRMETRINKARKKRDMTRLRPYRSLLKEFIDPVTENLKQWIASSSSRRGPKPIALPRLQQLDPATAALVVLRVVLRSLSIERRLIMGIAAEVGTGIEHEIQAGLWMEKDEDSWAAMERIYKTRGANAAHIKRSRVTVFNKHVADRIGYQPWTKEERIRVGLQLIDCVIQGTGRFRVVADRSAATSSARSRKGVKLSWPMVLEADMELLQWLSSAMDDELVFWPVYLPTVIKPKPWDGPKDGGYWTPFVRSPFLIRFKATHEEQRQRAIDEYMSLDMPMVYEAINYVQDTGWAINQRVLEVAQEVWDKDLGLGKFPVKEPQQVPQRPETDNEDVMREWRQEAGRINTENAKRVSRYLSTHIALNTAERMSGEPEFWFPHMLDFRGRMYPIPSDLSPQGNDLHRGLLQFSEGKPLGEHGAAWLAIHLANQFGLDKVSFEERIKWVSDRNDWWPSIAADPMADRRWADADDGDGSWQALAAAIDYAGYLKEGNSYVSHLPIRVDGTCNGIQHLSAMVRDRIGGGSVNLTKSDSPRDIYTDVAETLFGMLLNRKGELYADLWLNLFEDKVPRAVTKRPVMILPYGGTRMAYLNYTEEWLDKVDPRSVAIPKEHRPKALGFLVSLMWQAVSAKVEKARTVMEWLQDCSKVTSGTGRPLYWMTPVGFVVRHFYGERERRQVKTQIDGQRVDLVDWQIQATLDSKAQAKGIAPNFVHSMDASALMSCALLMKEAGVKSMTTIHDSYGTHAADMWTLFSCIREAFVQTYREPVLEQFLEACRDVAGEEQNWPTMPASGDLDIEEVFESDYFFA